MLYDFSISPEWERFPGLDKWRHIVSGAIVSGPEIIDHIERGDIIAFLDKKVADAKPAWRYSLYRDEWRHSPSGMIVSGVNVIQYSRKKDIVAYLNRRLAAAKENFAFS